MEGGRGEMKERRGKGRRRSEKREEAETDEEGQ